MAAEIPVAPFQSSRVEERNFWIFGQGISFSMSPTIHSAGFAHYNLPYTYNIHETKTVEELESLIKSPTFGGASVTMPHKLAIKMYCSEVSTHAKIIGAVNTLIRDETKESRVRGENTDWMGLASLLSDENIAFPKEIGLVIGAGGASRAALYALHKSGFKTIYLFNRTISRAEDIAQSLKPYFEIVVLDKLIDLPGNKAPHVIIGTIPADKTEVDFFPPVLFSQPEGICIDMAYKPRLTPLMIAARQLASRSWSTVPGVEVLLRQGFPQFDIWTGISAPETVMRQALSAKDAKEEADLKNRVKI